MAYQLVWLISELIEQLGQGLVVLGCMERVLWHLGGLLGSSWHLPMGFPHLANELESLVIEAFWGALGWLLGSLAAIFEALGASWQPLSGLLEHLGTSWGALGASWSGLAGLEGLSVPSRGILEALWCYLV